VLPIVYVC
jgi:hypothetical protein